MRKWLAILFSGISICSTGQVVDSFPIWKQELQGQLEPLQRQQLLIKISLEYEQVNKDSAIAYTKQALSLSQQLLDTPNQIFMLTRLGSGYPAFESKQQSIDYFTHGLELAEAIGDEKGISSILQFFAGFYMEQFDYRKALEYEQMALDHFRRSEDTTGIANVYAHLGGLHFSVQEYEMALKYLLTALALTEKDNAPSLVNLYLGNIAATYSLMGQPDNAAVFYQCQLQNASELQDSLALAQCYLSLGGFSIKQSDFDAAIRYYESALVLFQNDHFIANKINGYSGLVEVYMALGQYEKAMTFNNMAIGLVQREGSPETLNYLWKDQSLLYEKTNQPVKALIAYKQFILYRDSTINLSKRSEFARQDLQYNFEKQALADSLFQANILNLNQLKLQRQRIFTYSGLGGSILLLSMFTFLYRSYRQKQKSNRELAIAKDRAEQSEKFKQQFLANMSHEIRTPMNVVLGMTELVLDTPLNPKQKNYLTGIRRASSNLLHIINDILDLSKVEAGKLELEKIDFSIKEVISQVHELLNQKAIEKGLDLKMVMDADVPEVVIGDPNRLNQVILNLAGNAIKFTEKGSVTIQVSKGAEQDIIRFSILDTGIGIPKEKQAQIFESFTQAHSSDSRRYGGTGLGLTISRQFIELMGGTLSVQSIEGSGSTFSFAIPLPKGSIVRMTAANSSEQLDGSILNGLHILLVDDHEENRIVANDTLQSKSKVEITEAANGQEVIQLLNQQDFDVILMDVQMPVLDGYETTRQIRSTFSSPKNSIPIIALTASVIRSDLDKCRDAGMNDYVPKPFKTYELISALARATGRSGIKTTKSNSNSAQTFKSSWQKKDGSVIDLGYLESFCEGDRAKMKKYIMIFIGLSPMMLMKIKESLATKNVNGIATQLHGKRTQLKMMGMQECLDLATDLEKECRESSSNFESIENKTKYFIHQLEKGISELKSLAESEQGYV